MIDDGGTVIAAIIGAVVALAVGILIHIFNKRSLYAETVSNNRMDWVKMLRENIAKFISECTKEKNNREYLHEYGNTILLLLNPGDEHKFFKSLIEKLIADPRKITSSLYNDVIIESKRILKTEWVRVKVEAGETTIKKYWVQRKMEAFNLENKTNEIDKFKKYCMQRNGFVCMAYAILASIFFFVWRFSNCDFFKLIILFIAIGFAIMALSFISDFIAKYINRKQSVQ